MSIDNLWVERESNFQQNGPEATGIKGRTRQASGCPVQRIAEWLGPFEERARPTTLMRLQGPEKHYSPSTMAELRGHRWGSAASGVRSGALCWSSYEKTGGTQCVSRTAFRSRHKRWRRYSDRDARAETMSVFLKSSPLKSSGSPVTFARA